MAVDVSAAVCAKYPSTHGLAVAFTVRSAAACGQPLVAAFEEKVMKGMIAGLCLALAMGCARNAVSADWPQFMRTPEHTGDARNETLRIPLRLSTFVRLDDAILSSPAVVAAARSRMSVIAPSAALLRRGT